EALRAWADRDHAGGIDIRVHQEVMVLDLLEVRAVAEARRLEKIAEVAPQVRHLRDLVSIALEVVVINHVEANQGGVEVHIRRRGSGECSGVPPASRGWRRAR